MVASKGERDTLALVAAAVTAIFEGSDGQPVPASTVYVALGCDFRAYQKLAGILSRAGLCVVTPSSIALTEDGRRVGRDLSQMLAARAAEVALGAEMEP